MASKAELVKNVSILAEACRAKTTPATFLAFEEVLQDIDDATLAKAVKARLRDASPFMPSPGELRQLAVGIRDKAVRMAATAWQRVVSGNSTDPLAGHLLESLPVRHVDGEKFYVAGRQEFLRRYSELMHRHDCNTQLACQNLKLLAGPTKGGPGDE